MGRVAKLIKVENFAQIDIDRFRRRGFPEVIYCSGKTREQIKKIVGILLKQRQPLLLTRLDRKTFSYLKKYYSRLKYNPQGKVGYINPALSLKWIKDRARKNGVKLTAPKSKGVIGVI